MRFMLCALLAGLLSAATAQAQERVALLIGNSVYEHAGALRNPANDVARMASVLRDLGFDHVVIHLNLVEDELAEALIDFQQRAKGADTALVFYSGHGMELGGRNYLIPTDAALRKSGAERYEAVPLEFAIDAVDGATRLSVVIIDACRDSGPGGTRSRGRGFAPVGADRPGLAIAFATSPGQVAWDGDGDLSPYTRALTEVLTESPATDVRILFTSLGPTTTRYAGGEQRPFARFGDMPLGLASLSGDSTSVEPPEPAAPAPPSPRGPEATPDLGTFTECDVCPEMVVIPAGVFQMGSDDGDDNEKPLHRVSVARFAIGQTEVTFDEWDACAADGFCRAVPRGGAQDTDTDHGWGRGDRPVIEVSYGDITGADVKTRGFIAWLNAKVGADVYRLPSEAEWEYAARAGSSAKYSFGDSESQLDEHAWFGGNSGGKTHPVRGKTANAFGLHDMHGNVWELVQDCWNDSYSGAPSNGSAWMAGDCPSGVLRGGSWGYNPGNLRSAVRFMDLLGQRYGYVGFRVARTLSR